MNYDDALMLLGIIAFICGILYIIMGEPTMGLITIFGGLFLLHSANTCLSYTILKEQLERIEKELKR